MTQYWNDEELQAFGTEVARENHSSTLANANFLFVFCDPPKKVGGRCRAGTAEKVSKKLKDLGFTDADFMITIAKEVWEELTPGNKKALIDHELTHCVAVTNEEGEVKLSIRPHDIEDFIVIYERYGAWQPAIAALIEVIDARRRSEGNRIMENIRQRSVEEDVVESAEAEAPPE